LDSFLILAGAAVLIDDPNAHASPSNEEIMRWNEEQKAALIPTDTSDKKQAKKKPELSEEALEKRRLRQERKAAKHDGSLFVPPDEQQTPTPNIVPEPEPEPEIPHLTPRSSILFPWYRPTKHIYQSLESALSAGIWTYPSTSFQRARCDVFQDLWSKGHFLGIGIKFGADFLVYPGDPLRYHSHFSATVHIKDEKLSPMEIVAHGRLGTGTRKSHLICSWDELTGEVECFTIEWAGFG